MIAVALLLLIAAGSPADAPRETQAAVTSTQSLGDLQACITRAWLRFGAVTPIPMADGVALDVQMKVSPFAAPGKATLTFEIHDRGESRVLSVAYRHPISEKTALGYFRTTAKRCFAAEYAAAGLF
jgi:hypothetical protein